MNWVDFLALGITTLVVVLQMFRMKSGFSLIFYEMLFLAAAAFGADKLLPLLRQSFLVDEAWVYVGTFVILGGLGMIIASLLNKVFEFEAEWSRYMFGLIFAGITAVVITHVALKVLVIASGPRAAGVEEAISQSALGTLLVYGRSLGQPVPGLLDTN